MASHATAPGLSGPPGAPARLLLDEHYAVEVAERLRSDGHDAVAVLENQELRAQPDGDLFRWAAMQGRRIVTENIKDFRPLLVRAHATEEPVAPLLLVSPRRFRRGSGTRTEVIVQALEHWLNQPDAHARPDEDWLT